MNLQNHKQIYFFAASHIHRYKENGFIKVLPKPFVDIVESKWDNMWVSRFFCRALDGCLLIKAILLLLPSYCRDIVNIVVEVMLMMVWIVIILESNFSNKFLLIRILWSQDYILTVYYPDGRPPTFIVFEAITVPKGKKVLIVDWSSQSIGTRRTAWGLGSNFGETRNCFRPDFFISLLSSYMERKINNEKGKLFRADCFKNPKTVFFSVGLMLKCLFTFSCIFMMANPSKVASSGFFSKGSSETGNIDNFV